MASWTLLTVVCLILNILGRSTLSEATIRRTLFNGNRAQQMVGANKRPFCNAFTGCGRKRFEVPPEPPASEMESTDESRSNEENISSLLDLNAEPAVEDLSRQIMSEAKLWEAIQAANQELLRRKQITAERGNELAGMGGPNSGGKCSLSSCFI